MNRLFGTICNEPQRLHEALEPVRGTLFVPGPVQQWGLGYAQGGEVLLQRNPRSADQIDMYDALAGVKSDYIIMHAAEADDYKGNYNTQPFRYKKWLFAQSGGVDNFDEIKPALIEHIPDFMLRNIRGKSPAEHVFHVFLAFLHDAGVVADHNLPLAQSRRALRDTLAMVFSLITRAGGDRGPGNIIVTNSRSMLAVRVDAPMHVRRFKAPGKDKGHEFRAVLIASDGDDPGEGFEAIPKRSVIMVSRDLQIDIVELEA
jgi:predicted glutamine amidotransferase